MAKVTLEEFRTMFDVALDAAIEKTFKMSGGISGPVAVHEALQEFRDVMGEQLYDLEEKKRKKKLLSKRSKLSEGLSPSV